MATIQAAIEKLQALDIACSVNPLVPVAFREYFNATVPHFIVELETKAVCVDDGLDDASLFFESKLEALKQIAEWSTTAQSLLELCAQAGLTELARVRRLNDVRFTNSI
jgi:hypothetical protein